jgi:hypothetical protein
MFTPLTCLLKDRHMSSTASGINGNRSIGSPSTDRGLGWVAALVLILGSVLFLSGGRAHPAINAALGAAPEEFFRAFAEKIRHTHGWQPMHMLILIGPLCWAVAAPAVLDAIRPNARARISVARSALVLSATLWAVAFVLDGFGAPVYAEAIATAPSPDVTGALLTSFAAEAIMMSRFGLVSWVAGGIGMMILGGLLLYPGNRRAWRVAVGISGMLLGAAPLVASLQGEYAGGPFVSRFWMANALVVALWYVALASCALGGGPRRDLEGSEKR